MSKAHLFAPMKWVKEQFNKLKIDAIVSQTKGQFTFNGQSYQDIFPSLPKGKYIIMCNFASDTNVLVCSGSSLNGVFGDVSSGGCAYVDIPSDTTIQIYINTADANAHTFYRCRFTAIKIG